MTMSGCILFIFQFFDLRYEQIRGPQLEGIYFKNVGSVLAGIQGNTS